MKIAVCNQFNRKPIGKKEWYSVNSSFINRELDSTGLLNEFLEGHTICVAELKEQKVGFSYRKSENFLSAKIVGIDKENSKRSNPNDQKNIKYGNNIIYICNAAGRADKDHIQKVCSYSI